MYGYGGKVLHVNLTTQTTETRLLGKDEAKKYIGGLGLALRLVFDNTTPCIDPLDTKNVLVLSTGPMSGAMAPTGSGFVFAAKSPLTGAIGASLEQGFLGRSLIQAGFDAVVIRGRAKRATFLWIDNQNVEFADASDLWGLSPGRTEQAIRKNLGDSSVRVAAIGLAGERLARIASIVSDRTRVAARTGMGAVMGSKNLKAIAVRGSYDMEVSDPEGLLKFCREFFIKARGSSAVRFYSNSETIETVAVRDRDRATIYDSTAKYRDSGTLEDISIFNSMGCLPTRNFGALRFEGAERLSSKYLTQFYDVKVNASSPCPVGCEHIAIIPDGNDAGVAARLDYDSVWAFGPNCGVDNLASIIRALNLCNFYGIDATSTGNLIGFAMDCYEKGKIDCADTDGIDLKFGNAEGMLEVVKRIGMREGLGDVLAEGVKRAALRFGNEAETLANHIKGLEMPGYDVGDLKTAALGFAVSFRGADESSHWAHLLDIKGVADRFSLNEGRGILVKDMEDFFVIMDSMIVCKYLNGVYEGFRDLANLYNLVTGFGITPQDLRIAGERIVTLARIFNLREGFTRADDSLPTKALGCESNGNGVTQAELDLMLDDYYEVRGWTKEGSPRRETLERLGITSNLKV